MLNQFLCSLPWPTSHYNIHALPLALLCPQKHYKQTYCITETIIKGTSSDKEGYGTLRLAALCGKLWISSYVEIPQAEFTAQLEYAKHWLTFNVEGEETSKIKLHDAQKSLTWFHHQRQTACCCSASTQPTVWELNTNTAVMFHSEPLEWEINKEYEASGELKGGTSFCHFRRTSCHNTVEKYYGLFMQNITSGYISCHGITSVSKTW